MDKTDPLLKSKHYRRLKGRLVFAKPFDQLKGKLPKNPPAIRERLKPRLYDYSYIMTLASKQVLEKMQSRLPDKVHPLKILDMGCGYKPFQSLFPKDQYVGVDMSLNSYADVIADNQHLPFKDSVFDVVIITEVLEHCEDEYRVIGELRRVAKKDALVYLTMPFLFPLHGVPYDFNRFTKHKLKSFFKNDQIIEFAESNNIFGSVFIYFNMVVRILFGSALFFYPVYVVNNLLALAAANLSRLFRDDKGFIAEYWQYALAAFPIGYSILVRIKK